MTKELNKVDQCCLETIGIRQLSAEISMGLRSPITIRAGEVHEGMPGEKLSGMYADTRAYNLAAAGKE